MWENLLNGMLTVFEPINFLILLAAVFVGFLGGALPGISGVMLVVILLPVTYALEPTQAFMLLAAIYAASVFSGLITAILYRAPGTPEAVTTVFDGYPMTQKGEAGKALGIGILCSVIGGTIGTIVLIFFTPVLANIAIKFSSPEYFAMAILGLTVVAALSRGKLVLGLIGVIFGLFIATIGTDPLTGISRFTFGSTKLASGIELVPVIIGLFAVSEILNRTNNLKSVPKKIAQFKTKIFDLEVFKQIRGTIARSSAIGVLIGILPGVGASTAAMIAYSETVRWSKTPEKFGKGAPEGVAAPESANNAAAMGALVPLFALGIPGSGTTAVMLGAFVMHGLQPGPSFMRNNTDLIFAVFAALLLVNILILVLSKPFINGFSKLLNIPYSVIGPLIIIFCLIGTYAIRNSMFDVWVMIGFGILGYLLEKINFPVVTIILGVVLGPLAESEFRRTLQMSNGDYSIFFTRPISATLLAVAVLFILFPLVKSVLSIMKNRKVVVHQ